MQQNSNKPQAVSSQALKNRLKDAPFLREGDVTEVVLIRKGAREAFFDLGPCGTGMVYGREFVNAKELLKKAKPGDQIPAKVITVENDEGFAELSISQADEQRTWQQVKELQEAGEIVKITVLGANSGGLMTKILNLKAFLPISQLSNEHYPKVEDGDRHKIIEALKAFVGQELNVKLIDVNPRTNKLIVSEREILSANVKELLQGYQVGQVVDAIVLGIADFGVFVRFIDNPQIEGMIHISELDHRLVSNPKEVVKVNDALKVQIVDIRDGKVFLSLKALAPNPWETARERYQEDQEVRGEVYKFNPFGAIISLEGDLQGIIRISEFGGAEEMKQALAIGESYLFTVESIKPEEKRLILKLKKERE